MMEIRLATPYDLNGVVQLYDEATAYLEANINYPGWVRGEYPARQDAEEGLAHNCLFVAMAEDTVVGSMILRTGPEPAYKAAPWQLPLADNQYLVLHTVVVSPRRQKQGLGRQLMDYAAQYARQAGMQALRLDVYEKNLPAMRLYESCGFRYVHTVSLGLEPYGLDWFKLYEKLL